MPRPAALSETDARRVKQELWDGATTVKISEEYGLSQATISHIKTGKAYGDIPWPDQSIGGMPEHRRLLLRKGKYRDTRVAERLGERNAERYLEDTDQYFRDNFGVSLNDYVIEHIELAREKKFQKSMEESQKLADLIRAQNLPKAKPVTIRDWSPLTQKKVEWEYVLLIGEDWPIVQYYIANPTDYDLKTAIQIILEVIPKHLQNTPKMLSEIAYWKTRIVEWREKNKLASDVLALYNGDATGDLRPN